MPGAPPDRKVLRDFGTHPASPQAASHSPQVVGLRGDAPAGRKPPGAWATTTSGAVRLSAFLSSQRATLYFQQSSTPNRQRLVCDLNSGERSESSIYLLRVSVEPPCSREAVLAFSDQVQIASRLSVVGTPLSMSPTRSSLHLRK